VAAGFAATLTLALIAGCGSGSAGQASGGDESKATAGQAVAAAARDSAKITSMTVAETMTMRGLGLPSSGGLMTGGTGTGALGNGTVKMRANARLRLKPSLLAAMSINMDMAGRSFHFDEIFTSHAIYVKAPGLVPTHAGKPWGKISLAALPGGMNLRKLFNQSQNGNPITAMGSPAALAKFLANAKHLRVVGHETVDGVATTEYAGTLNLRALSAAMPAAQKKLLGSAPPNVPFRVWIDGQHHTRKLVMSFAFDKVSMSLAVHITSINEPVRIVAPPASQVSTMSPQ
jgi:LppX_LprAFG lipoprotein